MKAKFAVGSRVFLDGRTPKCLEAPRHRERTVVGVFYKPRLQACLYKLGDNRLGDDGLYLFRSYQLRPIEDMPGAGRPRQKRQWHHIKHRVNCVVKQDFDSQGQGFGGEAIQYYSEVDKTQSSAREGQING